MTIPSKHGTTILRSRSERLLRYMLRRRPCAVLVGIEILVMSLLIGMIIFFLTVGNSEKDRLSKTHRENIHKDDLEKYGINFWYCNYEQMWKDIEDFNTDNFCDKEAGENAVAYAVLRTVTKTTNSRFCPNQIEAVPCHNVDGDIWRKGTVLNITGCPGLFGEPMPARLITSELDVRELAEIMQSKKKTAVLANNLFMKCPRCRVKTLYYRYDTQGKEGVCFRQLDTMKPGWPSSAEYCDEEEEHEIDIEKRVYC